SEDFSPGSASRRVVPWGTVSSWVKGVYEPIAYCILSEPTSIIQVSGRSAKVEMKTIVRSC
ncbi:MAG TPA: hypothetical protein VGR30_06040, partial [Candidatus Binatia bacterium]|nr:hypothetical protein [Candidatus Binatia bacterium]